MSVAVCPTLDVRLWPVGPRPTGAPVPGSPDPSWRRAACIHVRDGNLELVRQATPVPVGEDVPVHGGAAPLDREPEGSGEPQGGAPVRRGAP